MKTKMYKFRIAIIITLANLLIISSVSAQAPEKMSYQAVIRDAGNSLTTNQAVGIKISILQGGATGTAVYVETQTPTTNTNGLVSLEIGTGTIVTGTFAGINWATGPYFIKTETDPTGGTAYTIAGTNELMSVPYALHAKTAEIVTETDPTFTSSQAASITASDITNLGNLSGTNTGDQDLSALATSTAVTTGLALKVDKVTGKDLEANGTAAGQMQYWNGTAWVTVAAGNEGATLQMIGGVPTWTGGTPPPTPNVTNATTGKIWMDRNLGASQVATSSTDAASYGDLYQWGRATDGHQIRTSGTTATLSAFDQPGHGDFITTNSGNYDWRSPQNASLWQGVSGVNNPCPIGYRLPTDTELVAERASWGTNDAAGAFASVLKLPMAGTRDVSNGSLNNVGSYGLYWSSTVSSTSSRGLYFFSSTAGMFAVDRANGFSVRCLKD
jgi:uncharacterized protein (TIGR02145 family)